MDTFDLPVERHMLTAVRTIRDNARLSTAALAFEKLGISALPVQDASARLTGVLERADLMRAGRFRGRDAGGEARWSFPEGHVSEWMRTVVPVVSRTQTLRQCARRMVQRGVRRLYVVADHDVCGVLGTREMARAVAGSEVDTPIGQVAREMRTIAMSAPLSAAAALWSASAQPIIVLDGDAPVGVFARNEMLAGLEANPADGTELWMDRSVLTLPASTPMHVAAQRALDARARYVIAHDGAYRLVTGLDFAECVAGERSSSPPPASVFPGEPALANVPSSPLSAPPGEESRPQPFAVRSGSSESSARAQPPAAAAPEREAEPSSTPEPEPDPRSRT